MSSPRDTFDWLFDLTATPWYAAFVIAWLAVWLSGTGVYRAHKGKLFPKTPPEALFSESWTSGRSERSLLARIGGARNCLHVVLTRERLTIDPEFPFNLLPLELAYDTVQDIPIADISRVSPRPRLLGGDDVLVEFTDRKGRRSRYALALRNPQAMIAAAVGLASLRQEAIVR